MDTHRWPRGREVGWPAAALAVAFLGGAVVAMAGSTNLALRAALALAGLAIFALLPRRGALPLVAVSFAPVSVVAHSTIPLVAATLLLAWSGTGLAVPRPLRPWLLLLALMLGRLLLNPLLGGSHNLGTVMRVVLAFTFGLAACAWIRSDRDFLILAILILLVPTLRAVYELASGIHDVEGRIAGGFPSAPVLGLTGALVFAAIWPVALQMRSLLGGVAGFMSLLDVVVSGTRGAFLACAVVAILPALVTQGRAGRRFRRGLLVLILLAPLALPFSHSLTARLQNALQSGTAQYQSGDTSSSIGIRATIDRRLNTAFAAGDAQRRFLGQGPGASEDVIRTTFQDQLHLPHNEYLRMKLDTGWLGLGVFLFCLLAGVLRLIGRTYFSSDLRAATVACAVAVLGLTDNPLFYPVALALGFAAIGLSVASDRASALSDSVRSTMTREIHSERVAVPV